MMCDRPSVNAPERLEHHHHHHQGNIPFLHLSLLPLDKHDGMIPNLPPPASPPPFLRLQLDLRWCCNLPFRSGHAPLIHFTLLLCLSFLEFLTHAAHTGTNGRHGKNCSGAGGKIVANALSHSAVSCFHYLNSHGEGPATAVLLHSTLTTLSVPHAARPPSTVRHLHPGWRVCSPWPSRD